MQWNPVILERQIAPGITTFTSASIPDLSEQFPEAKHWLANHFLNSVLRASWSEGYRQLVIAILRRAAETYSAYNDARELTLQYLEGNEVLNPKIRDYYTAIAKWETFAVSSQIVTDLFKRFNSEGAFTKGDGSSVNRLYQIGNNVKHLPKGTDYKGPGAEDILPLWIDATGLHSPNAVVLYDEAAEIVTDICNFADELQDPIKFVEKTKAAAEQKPRDE